MLNAPVATGHEQPAIEPVDSEALSASDRNLRRALENRIIRIFLDRLEAASSDLDLDEVHRILKSYCELKKCDTAVERVQITRARAAATPATRSRATAPLDQSHDHPERKTTPYPDPDREPDRFQAILRRGVRAVYGLDIRDNSQPGRPRVKQRIDLINPPYDRMPDPHPDPHDP